jgi:chromate reductase
MSEPIQVLVLLGSLRKGSYNRMLLEAVRGMLPAGLALQTAEISDLPLYNEDLRIDGGFPAPAARLRSQIAAADAVLFISPEYNYSIPGVLKNAIDWASRPPDQPFAAKPAGILGASPGLMGTVRMQYHLRQVLGALDVRTMQRPEIMIARAGERFDPSGKLTDAKTIEVLGKYLAAFEAWVRREIALRSAG